MSLRHRLCRALSAAALSLSGLFAVSPAAHAIEVRFDSILSLPETGPMYGEFIGYDLNHDGFLRSADGEIARASSSIGGTWWNMDRGWWTWDDVGYYNPENVLPPTIDFQYVVDPATGALSGWLLGYDTVYLCNYFCNPTGFEYGRRAPGEPYKARLYYSSCNRYTGDCRGAEVFESSYSPLWGYPAYGKVVVMGNVVPEPATWALLAGGLMLLGGSAAQRRRQAQGSAAGRAHLRV